MKSAQVEIWSRLSDVDTRDQWLTTIVLREADIRLLISISLVGLDWKAHIEENLLARLARSVPTSNSHEFLIPSWIRHN